MTDVVRALLAAMALRPAHAPVFNVCTGRATTVVDLARLIANLSGQALDVRHGPPRAGEIRDSLGDPHYARLVLGLPDAVELRAGLGKVLEWMATAR